MRRAIGFGAGLVGVTLAIGCGSSSSGSLGQSQQALEALTPLQGCGEVEAYIRSTYEAEINDYFDQRIAEIEKSESASCGRSYGDADAPVPSSASSGSSGGASSSSGGAPTAGSTSSDAKAESASGTNNQVAGVDEADFVKNDGQYLYIVANGAFRILRAYPADLAGPVAKVTVPGTPKQLFVEGDRAVVYVSMPRSNQAGSSSSSSASSGRSACTYGYDCVPSGDGTATKVLVFDISNRAEPKTIRDVDLSGSLLAARRIGDAVHTVVVDPPLANPNFTRYPKSLPSCDPSEDPLSRKTKLVQAYEELRAQNLATLASLDVMSLLPSFREGGADAVPSCTGYYRPNLAEGRSFTSVVSVDIAGGPLQTATVVSDPGVVYASETGLYLSVPHTRSGAPPGRWYPSMETEEQASTVHQFRIGATSSLTGYVASGIVKGRVLNQFGMDEWEQHLRIATTTGHAPQPETHSTMSVLARAGNALELTGSVDQIAVGEDIRSVRFDGSRGFVVTFKKTDPLYAFDLGDPSKPRITGELKIPGFSTYMHMMDATHLLTIGYDASDQGSFAWFTGVMLQIFDVSDMNNPKLAHKEVIGTRGSSSEALTNHLAFNYYAPKNLLALPMTICEGGNANGGYGTTMTFSGLIVYDTTTSAGFQLRGRVAHPSSPSASGSSSGGFYDNAACQTWWTQARSEVQRSVVMDDFIYSISQTRVKINALSNLGVDVKELALDP